MHADPLLRDFDPDAIGAVGPTAEPASPQVLVVYRDRGVPWLLVPPLLILSGVAGIVAYRRSAPPAGPPPTLAAPAGPSVAVEVALADLGPPRIAPPVASPPPDRPADPAPPPAPVEPAPVPAPVPGPTPASAVNAEPAGADPFDTPVEPPADAVDREATRVEVRGADEPVMDVERPRSILAIPHPPSPSILAPAPPDTVQVQDEIRREAERIEAERAELNAAKPFLNRTARRDAVARMDDLQGEWRRIADGDRAPFHADLRKIYAEFGGRSGSRIEALAQEYGFETIPEILKAADRDLQGPSTRLSPPARIERMRRRGVPEPLILRDLYLTQRYETRTEGQAWTLAARILLGYPPRPANPRPAAPSAPSPGPPDRPVPSR